MLVLSRAGTTGPQKPEKGTTASATCTTMKPLERAPDIPRPCTGICPSSGDTDMDTTCQVSSVVDVILFLFAHSRHCCHSTVDCSGSPGRFRRRLIPLICADWLPQDLVTSGSHLALGSGAG